MGTAQCSLLPPIKPHPCCTTPAFTQRIASSLHSIPLVPLTDILPPAMASSVCATTALLLSLSLLFLTLVSGTSYVPCPPPPIKPPPVIPPPSCGTCPPAYPSCPRDALKLGVCADVLNVLKLKQGTPPKYPCCSLLEDLADLEAAVCLCTAIKANILGTNLNIPIDLSLLLNYCGKTVPQDFQCA